MNETQTAVWITVAVVTLLLGRLLFGSAAAPGRQAARLLEGSVLVLRRNFWIVLVFVVGDLAGEILWRLAVAIIERYIRQLPRPSVTMPTLIPWDAFLLWAADNVLPKLTVLAWPAVAGAPGERQRAEP